MKFKKGIALALATVFLLAGCGKAAEQPAPSESAPAASSEKPSEKPAESKAPENTASYDKDIVIAVNNNFITMDAHAGRDSLSNSAIATMMEGLVEYDKDLQLQPNLAEKWEISDDAKTYTFYLRKDVKFTDGEPFNAEAVKVNIDRVMDASKALRHARTFNTTEKVEVKDEYTISVTLKDPYMAFLSRLEAFKIMSPKAIKENEAGLAKHPIGTGPFIFKEWVEGDHMTIVKNPDHRRADQIGVDSITYKFVPENGSRVAMLETGEADIIYPMPSEMMEKIKGNANIVTEIKPSTVCRYVTMNQLKEPFNDVRVRKALNYAIDKAAYIQVVKGGYGSPLNSALSPVLPFYADHDPYEYDVEKAKALLAEAGYPNGFKATIWGNTETETVKGMNFINQQLSLIGVEIEVMPMEEGTLSTKVYDTTPETTELEMWYVSWSATDPDNAVRSTFQSEMVPPAGANTNYYNNPAVDTAIANGNKATTFEDQYKFYKEAQDLIWDDAVWMFMGIDQTVIAKQAYITGANLAGNGGAIDLREIGVK